MNENDTQDTLLGRWIAGDLNEAELKEFESRPDFEDLKRIVEGVDEMEAPEFDETASWERLAARAGLEEEESEETPTIPLTPASGNPGFLQRYRWAGLAVAASIAILVVVFLNLGGDGSTEFITKATETQSVQLPDGSTVQLNAGSTLRFSEGSWDEQRTLDLEGEAFFEVAKGKRFEVNTPSGTVEVLGTSFNVKSREKGLQVACYTGKVRVSDAKGKEAAILEPGNGVAIDASGEISAFNAAGQGPAWQKGLFEYSNVPFPEVADEVQRQFGIELTYKGLEEKRFSGDFNKKDLKQTLQSLTLPYGYEWKELEKGKYELFLAP